MAGIGTNVDFASAPMYGRDGSGQTPGGLAPTTGGAAADNKMWLPIWSGEVMRAFDQYRMFEPLVESRTISSGRVMEFPITGTVAMMPAWGAGQELVGGIEDSASTTFAVSLDARPIASHFELDNVDLMITQWEFRSELARQAGQTLANARDMQVGSFLARAGGEVLIDTDPRLKVVSEAGDHTKWRNTLVNAPIFDTTFDPDLAFLGNGNDTQRADAALALLKALEEFCIHLQEINAPSEGIYCAVTPRTFQDIRALGVARESADLVGGAGRPYFGGVADAGGLGAGLQQGMNALTDSLTYMGVTIIKSQHIIGKDQSGVGQEIGEARYNGDFSKVGAIIWQKGSVASLNQTGLKVDTVDDIRRNTVFTVASVMGGTGVLRPECVSLVMNSPMTGATTAAKRTFALTNAGVMDLSKEYVKAV
jgi:hypothetical protein